jgi:hypothetical protein
MIERLSEKLLQSERMLLLRNNMTAILNERRKRTKPERAPRTEGRRLVLRVVKNEAETLETNLRTKVKTENFQAAVING